MSGKAITKKKNEKHPLNQNEGEGDDDSPPVEFPSRVIAVDYLAALRQLIITVAPSIHLAAIEVERLHRVLHRLDRFRALPILNSLNQLRHFCPDCFEVDQLPTDDTRSHRQRRPRVHRTRGGLSQCA